MKAVEVLAPAGGWDALEAGVRSGADAVYLGGPAFGARASAKNFTREELEKAAAFCHARGGAPPRDGEHPVKGPGAAPGGGIRPVFVLPAGGRGAGPGPGAVRRPAPPGPRAAFALLHPDEPAHSGGGEAPCGSGGPAGWCWPGRCPFRRSERPGIPALWNWKPSSTGALCMSVSGQCYLSAMLGGRSGNRGMCAQPCRLPFAAPGGTGHDLSLKDLSLLERAQDLMEAGVCSLKIEGRMKRPEYVAAAVSACRLAAGGEAVPQELAQDLEAVFSRSGLYPGVPDRRPGPGQCSAPGGRRMSPPPRSRCSRNSGGCTGGSCPGCRWT